MSNAQLPKRVVIAAVGLAMLAVGLVGLSSFPMTLSSTTFQPAGTFTGTTQFASPAGPMPGFNTQMGSMMGPMMGSGMMMGPMARFNAQMQPMGGSITAVPMQPVPIGAITILPSTNSLGTIPGTAIPLYPILLIGIYGGLIAAGASMIFRAVSPVIKTEASAGNKELTVHR